MLKRRAWGQPWGSWLGQVLLTLGAGIQGVRLVLAVTDLLVPSKLGREAEMEIIGNPSIAPPGSLGADVDERHAFLPAKIGSGAPLVPWPSWSLDASSGKVLDWGLGAFREHRW